MTQNFIKTIDKNIDDMEKDKDFIKSANAELQNSGPESGIYKFYYS